MMTGLRPLAAGIAAVFLFAAAAQAQVFPTRGDTQVTDDADLIDPATEARLAERLAAIKAETGADVAVVTLLSTALYTGGEDVDVYAGQLFEALDLNAVPEGKAALLLVFRDDRELRIETGTAYGADSSATATGIINDLILPRFQTEDYAGGIEAGIDGIIGRIVAPEPVAEAPAPVADAPVESDAPVERGGGGGLWWLLGLIAVPVGGIIYAVRRSAAKLAATPCPSCGKTGLTRASVTVEPATTYAEGKGETRTTCPHCGNVTAVPYTISRLQPKDKAKSGASVKAAETKGQTDKTKDGSKQGGGASGSW